MKCAPCTPETPAMPSAQDRQLLRYYIGTGPEAEALIASATKQNMDHIRKCDALNAATVRADHLHKHRGHILGFCWDVDPGSQPVQRVCLRRVRRETVYEIAVDVYRPDSNTEDGKALIERIRAVGGYSPNEWIRDQMGLDMSSQVQTNALPASFGCGLWLLNTSVMYAQRTIYVQVPELQKVNLPTPPAWCKRVMAGEFYAHIEDDQTKKVRQ